MGGLKVLQPQEVEVFYLLPAIRRELAISLKEAGHGQKQIAAMLGVTDAAISQYVSGKRGAEALSPTFNKLIKQAAADVKDGRSAYAVTQQLMQQASDSGLLCEMHMRLDPSVPQKCNVCFEGKTNKGANHGFR